MESNSDHKQYVTRKEFERIEKLLVEIVIEIGKIDTKINNLCMQSQTLSEKDKTILQTKNHLNKTLEIENEVSNFKEDLDSLNKEL